MLLHGAYHSLYVYESMPCSIFCIYPLVNNLSSQAWSESYTLVVNGVSPAPSCWVFVAGITAVHTSDGGAKKPVAIILQADPLAMLSLHICPSQCRHRS